MEACELHCITFRIFAYVLGFSAYVDQLIVQYKAMIIPIKLKNLKFTHYKGVILMCFLMCNLPCIKVFKNQALQMLS